MRYGRMTLAMTVVLSAAALSGCSVGTETSARMLVEPSTSLGKLTLGLTANGAGLAAMKQISQKRRLMGMGVEIDVWVIKAREPKDKTDWTGAKGTVVLLHPLMANKLWFHPLGALLARRGWDVVLPDLRAHGRSGGEYVTWGAREKLDIQMVMNALIGDGTVSDRIYVCGASLGGLVALQYAAMDRRIRGVMAIASPASFRKIGRRILPLESARDYDETLWKAGAIAGFNPDSASGVRAAGELTCPLVLIHGLLDPIVPYSHSKAIYKAAHEPKKLITQALQGHDAGMGQELWIASQIAKLAKTKYVPRPRTIAAPSAYDIENFDEEKILEEIRRLDAIQKSLNKPSRKPRGKYE